MRYRYTFILQHTEFYFVRDCSDILSMYVCTDINTFYSWDFFYQKKAYGEKWEKLLRDIALQRLCQVRQMAFVTHCAWTFTSWCAILTYRLSYFCYSHLTAFLRSSERSLHFVVLYLPEDHTSEKCRALLNTVKKTSTVGVAAAQLTWFCIAYIAYPSIAQESKLHIRKSSLKFPALTEETFIIFHTAVIWFSSIFSTLRQCDRCPDPHWVEGICRWTQSHLWCCPWPRCGPCR